MTYLNWIGQDQQPCNCATVDPLVAVLALASLDNSRAVTAQLLHLWLRTCSTVRPLLAVLGLSKWTILRTATAQQCNNNSATLQPLVAALVFSKLASPNTTTVQLHNSSTFGLLFLIDPMYMPKENQPCKCATAQLCSSRTIRIG